jgi:hypothetical protein
MLDEGDHLRNGPLLAAVVPILVTPLLLVGKHTRILPSRGVSAIFDQDECRFDVLPWNSQLLGGNLVKVLELVGDGVID